MSENIQQFVQEAQRLTTQARPQSFMQELDTWTEDQVVSPLLDAWAGQEDNPVSQEAVELATQEVKKAIREKVLESYHNGQKAGPRKPFQKRR